MSYLHYFIYWLISRSLSNDLDICRNNTTGENGMCLSEWSCTGIAEGINIGRCNNGVSDAICCKVILNYDNEAVDLSSFIFTNIQKSHLGKNLEKSSENAKKYGGNHAYSNHPDDVKFAETTILPGTSTADNMHIPYYEKSILNNILQKMSNYQNIRKSPGFQSYEMRKPVQTHLTHDMRRPVQTDPMQDMRRPVETNPMQDMRRPVQTDPMQDMRRPVQTDLTHGIQKLIQTHQTHNMLKTVQIYPKQDMRKPIQTHPTHDMRMPVQMDPTDDMRKPVKLVESHNLRWPVRVEYFQNLQNPIAEYDTSEFNIYRSGDMVNIPSKILHKYSNTGAKNSVFDEEHDSGYRHLYDDEFLKLNCASRNETSSRHETIKIQSNYRELFNHSCRVCGLPFNTSTEKTNEERLSSNWPWTVSLQEYIFHRFWHKCGGSLLNNFWVITAAHCVDLRPKWDFRLLLGKEVYDESQQYIERFIDRIAIHPKFNNVNLDHDIALVRMESPVVFQTDIIPICLPWRTDEMKNKIATALAWQLATEKRVLNNIVKERIVPVITNKECEILFSKTGSTESIQQSFVCASFNGEIHDSCIGDSGGPLAILDIDGRWSLTGLYSWAKTCRTPNQPEVYIRISRYAKWIEDTISCYENVIRSFEIM